MNQAKLQDGAVLVLRVVLGTLMIYYGAQKLFGVFGGMGFAATVQAMQEGKGIPPLFGYLAMAGEFLGGLGVLLGLLTRVAAFGVACTMAVATFFNLSDPATLAAFGSGDPLVAKAAYPLSLFAMAVAVMLLGGGMWALDGRVFGGGKRTRKS